MFPADAPEYRTWDPARKVMVLVFAAGLAARLILAPFFSSPFDTGCWVGVMTGAYSGDTIYETGFFFYTPLWGYVLYGLAALADISGMGSFGILVPEAVDGGFGLVNGFATSPQTNILIKTPLIMADFLSGILVYRLVGRISQDQRKAVIGFALWTLCPLMIVSSSVLLMFESIMLFFMLLSILFFMDRRYFLAGAMLSAAVLTKMFAVMILPLMIEYILSEKDVVGKDRMMNLLHAFLGFVMVSFILYLPVIVNGELSASISFLTERWEGVASGERPADSFSNVFLFVGIFVVFSIVGALTVAFSKRDKETVLMWMMAIGLAVLFSVPRISQPPTFGVMVLSGAILMYAMKGLKPAILPWTLTFVYVLSAISHYGKELFFTWTAYHGTAYAEGSSRIILDPALEYLSQRFYLPGLALIILSVCYLCLHYIQREEGRCG